MTQLNQPQHPDKFFHLDSEFRARFINELNQEHAPLWLDLLDETGKLFDLNASRVAELVSRHLAEANATIRILTFEPDSLSGHAPRFQELRSRFGHKVGWRILPAPYQGRTQDSAALFRGPNGCLLRKPVRTAYHGYQTNEASDVAAYLDFFEQAWDSSEDAPPVHILGI